MPPSNNAYEQRLQQAVHALREADHVIIGGGAGLSAAAGLTYEGKRFTDNFGTFIDQYGMTDMYTSSFHLFPSEEARWAYWAVHIRVNRYDPPILPLYRDLSTLVSPKSHFVVTTNVDHQFFKAGFDPDRVFAVQGDYGLCQCAKGCHSHVYENARWVEEWTSKMTGVLIPSDLVPTCPVCGGPMDVHLRKDQFFVEDEDWHEASNRYTTFLRQNRKKSIVLLEMGVGFNTPGIIRFPFEQMARGSRNITLIRFNNLHIVGLPGNEDKTIPFMEEMGCVVRDLVHSISSEDKTHHQKRKKVSSLASTMKTQDNHVLSTEKCLAEKLAYLINGLSPSALVPAAESERWRLFRSLVNMRKPGPLPSVWLQVQDSVLKEEIIRRGPSGLEDLAPIQPMLYIWRGDITLLKVDAIVNAANNGLRGCFSPCHSCIDNAIHTFAGVQLRNECDSLMKAQAHPEPTGQARMTLAYNLPARHIIHTVGPIVSGELTCQHKEQLAACYESSILLADSKGLESIALCCISTGEYGFPQEPAAEIAIRTVQEAIPKCQSLKHYIFDVFTDEDETIYRKILSHA